MVIDFHSHTYPPKIADMVVRRLSGPSGVKAFTDATAAGLEESCVRNNIEKAIVLPVVTSPRQAESINRIAVETNQREGRLLSFGGIHPDNSDYRRIFSTLAAEGIQGIKLHPVFQQVYFDDIKYMRIVDCACEYGFIISVHAGLDVNDKENRYCDIPHLKNLLKTVKPDKMILGHMGGHLCWDRAEEMLMDYKAQAPSNRAIYLDTAFCLPSPVAEQNIDCAYMTKEHFIRMVRLIGADRVLFGTDSPWADQGPAIDAIKNSGLTEKEIFRILYENAKDLLSY